MVIDCELELVLVTEVVIEVVIEVVREVVMETVREKELVTLVVMVPEKEGDTPTTTPDVEMLDEIADPDPIETEELVEIPDAALIVLLTETPPAAPADALTDTAATVETVSVILAEPDTEHIRRTRA